MFALHSNGERLQWHPHIHAIVLAGGILPDGTCAQVGIDPQELTARFPKYVLDELLKLDLITQDIGALA